MAQIEVVCVKRKDGAKTGRIEWLGLHLPTLDLQMVVFGGKSLDLDIQEACTCPGYKKEVVRCITVKYASQLEKEGVVFISRTPEGTNAVAIRLNGKTAITEADGTIWNNLGHKPHCEDVPTGIASVL